ncbi:MAG: hypothetical protein ACK5LC_04220 [Coprobacillaceae bacterium]
MKLIEIDIKEKQLQVEIFDEDNDRIHFYKTPKDTNLTVEENLSKLIQYIHLFDYPYQVIRLRSIKFWNIQSVVSYISQKTNLEIEFC